MSQQPSERPLLRFGVFELNVSAGELRRQGRKLNLQQQPFQVLTLLLRRPGEVVTREELQQELWPGDTFVEFGQGLNTAIKKIRRALGDSADNPRFVETIPRKGYRFIAPVSSCASDPQESSQARSLVNRRPLPRTLAVLVVLAVVAGTAVWVLSRDSDATTVEPVPVPLTSDPGSESAPSFSPDGTQVVFQRLLPGRTYQIHTKRVGQESSRYLADGSYPASSPDGRTIAFVDVVKPGSSSTEIETGVHLISPLGGPSTKLTGLHVNYIPVVAWHPSGKWLIVTDKESADKPGALFALSIEDGTKRRLTTPPPGFFDNFPAVSPDGSAVVFSRYGEGASAYPYLLELSGECEPKGKLKRLTDENGFASHAAWTADGSGIVFAVGSIHHPALYEMKISRPGWVSGTPERLTFAGRIARTPAVSENGNLAYSSTRSVADIWRLELDGIGTAAGPPTSLIPSTWLDHVPQYSPDGQRIAFASHRSGSNEIYVANSDGSGVRKLTSFGGFMYTADPVWSPDSQRIAFSSNPEELRNSYVIVINGGDPEQLCTNCVATGWSKDGKWVYVVTDGKIWKKPWPPVGEHEQGIQLAPTGVQLARESPDGEVLYYLKGAYPNSLWSMPVRGGEETQVLESVCCHSFAATEEGVYFIPGPLKDHASIQYLSFATRNVARLATLNHHPAYGFSLSPDRRSLLFTQFMPAQGDLWLVNDFH